MTQTRITATVRTKVMPCRSCGKDMIVGSNTRNMPRHLECGIKTMIENMQQMQSKSGPNYDRWLSGMYSFLEKQARAGEGP